MVQDEGLTLKMLWTTALCILCFVREMDAAICRYALTVRLGSLSCWEMEQLPFRLFPQ